MDTEPLRAVEFYSGIGGWAYAAAEAAADLGLQIQVVAAFDVSTTCNGIYEANFGLRPSQRPIERLTAHDLDALRADLWLMSPPCQPHTRQRNNRGCEGGGRDCEDPRAASFLHLCELLPVLTSPPCLLALENVVGFSTSSCASHWRAALRAAGFEPPHEWHLTPTMVGVPNERPRYYAAAVRHPRREGSAIPPVPWASTKEAEDVDVDDTAAEVLISTDWPGRLPEQTSLPLRAVSEYLELPEKICEESGDGQWLDPWRVPAAVIEKDAAWCFDIATPSLGGEATACFTHSYGRFARGTGSVLYVPLADSLRKYEEDVAGPLRVMAGPDARLDPASRTFGSCWRERLHRGGGELRYFTPREVANLLGFPPQNPNAVDSCGAPLPGFALPPDISATRAWAALGNSIHIGTAAAVIKVAVVDALRLNSRN